jgi:hypothetical protein
VTDQPTHLHGQKLDPAGAAMIPEPTERTTVPDQPTPDKLDMGLQADADIRYSNDQLPTRDEAIRINALNLAVAAQPRLLSGEPIEPILDAAARLEAFIRGDRG